MLEKSIKYDRSFFSYLLSSKIIKKKSHHAHKAFLTYFVVKDIGVNAIYTYGWKLLAELSS